MAQPGVRFLYVPAIDLEEMRHFYSKIIGLSEICLGLGEDVAHDSDGVPQWVGNRSSPARDPMGSTVERPSPADASATTTWAG